MACLVPGHWMSVSSSQSYGALCFTHCRFIVRSGVCGLLSNVLSWVVGLDESKLQHLVCMWVVLDSKCQGILIGIVFAYYSKKTEIIITISE